MASFKQLVVLLGSLATFIYTIYVVGKFMMFLSVPRVVPKMYTWVFNLLDNESRLKTAYGPIVYDTLYLIGFIFQHSFMKSSMVKKIIQSLGLAAAERTIYCLTSSICLHYLLKHWISAQSIILWQVDVGNNSVLWWSFVLIHLFSWMIVYGGSLIMDLFEMMGVKQAYYDLEGYSSPIVYKSFNLRHLYAHMRHPSFTGLTVIMWATNCMSLDRLLLAIMLTAYMYFAWSTDYIDVTYQKRQYRRKAIELKAR